MKKNTKKKLKDIRSAIVMMCVMVAMMSTASYAWFTLSASPTVVGMQMTAAASGGGLTIANATESGLADTYYSNIIIKDTNETKMLKPVTPNLETVGAFKSPIYTGDTVTGLAAIPEADQKTYVAKYTYWLKSTANEDGGTVGVGIIVGGQQAGNAMGLSSGDDSTPLLNGSFVRPSEKNPVAKDVDPANAVRVGFVLTNTTSQTVRESLNKLIIWEPNADNNDVATLAPQTVDNGINTEIENFIKLRSNTDGTIVKGGSGNISDVLFTMENGKEVKIEMYVWLQGSDLQCGNEIQAGNLEAQIQFTAIDVNTP